MRAIRQKVKNTGNFIEFYSISPQKKKSDMNVNVQSVE